MKKLFFAFLLVSFVGFGQEKNWCDDITLRKSKFTNVKTYDSPLNEIVSFTKIGKDIYLSLRTRVYSFDTKQYGVTILLDDGKKIIKPKEAVSFDYSDGFYCSAFILLNKIDIKKIDDSYINDFKLYIHEQEVVNSEKYSEYFTCILEK